MPPPQASWEKRRGLVEPAPTFTMAELAVSVLAPMGWGTLSVARHGACTTAAAGAAAGGSEMPPCCWGE